MVYCFGKFSIPCATQIFKSFVEKMFKHLIILRRRDKWMANRRWLKSVSHNFHDEDYIQIEIREVRP